MYTLRVDIFTERLNKLIKDSKTTKYKVAKELGCSKQSVCNWCNGTSEPTITYLRKLAILFNESADYLLGLSDDL